MYLMAFIFSKEMSVILRSSVIRAINLSPFAATLPTMMFAIFSVYAGIGECVTLRKVFVSLLLLTAARIVSIYDFIAAVSHLSEATVAIKRIQVGLMLITAVSSLIIIIVDFNCLEILAAG